MYAHERRDRQGRIHEITTIHRPGRTLVYHKPQAMSSAIIMPTPDWTYALEMARYLRHRRIDQKTVVFNGWYPSRSAGDNQVRVVIPGTPTSRGLFWQARSLQEPLGGEMGHKRYESPPGPREDALIRLWSPSGRSRRPPLIVVEGPMDAAVAAMYGFDAVALMGNSPPEPAKEHLRGIMKCFPWTAFVADADSLDRMQRLVIECSSSTWTMLLSPAPAKDLAEASDHQRAELFRRLDDTNP